MLIFPQKKRENTIKLQMVKEHGKNRRPQKNFLKKLLFV
jgi:hypothetical protein